MKRDLVCGVLMLALAIAYYCVAAAIPNSTLADAVGPQGLPLGYAVALGVLSLLLIATSVFKRGGGITSNVSGATLAAANKSDLHAALRGFGLLMVGVFYVILLPYAGYIVSIALLIFAIIFYLEGRISRWSVPIAAIGGVVFWVLFVEVLQVPEPAGLWPSFV